MIITNHKQCIFVFCFFVEVGVGGVYLCELCELCNKHYNQFVKLSATAVYVTMVSL